MLRIFYGVLLLLSACSSTDQVSDFHTYAYNFDYESKPPYIEDLERAMRHGVKNPNVK